MVKRALCDLCKKDVLLSPDQTPRLILKLNSETKEYDLCAGCYMSSKMKLEGMQPPQDKKKFGFF